MMGAAGYILAINLGVAAMFAAAFAAVSLHVAVRRPAWWFAATYALGMGFYGFEGLVPLTPLPRLFVFAAFASFLLALAAYCVGLARRYRVDAPRQVLGLVVALSLPLNLLIYDMPRASFLRVLLYQLPYAVLMAVAAWTVLRASARRRFDWVLFALLAAGAAHFLSKAWLAVLLGPGSSARSYLSSAYALVSQATGAILIVGMGLLTLALLVRDMLAEATEKSETDPLTGLLNRRGFEDRARLVARLMARTRVPAAIVICDLDHFKAVNDNYGHASGDRVIAAFAARLREAVSENHVAGRIGGEEFAVIMPGANAATARLLAEGVRGAFASAPIEGLPQHLRFTASFGVAELEAGDAMADMLRRADSALYEAKAGGRDCVRVAAGATASPRRSLRGAAS